MSNIQSLPLGTELVGDYRIERVLGAGGFGVTYLARETDLDRFVTIKEYFPADFASRQGELEAVPRTSGSTEDYQWGLDRFIDEARTLGKFNHPNIVRVYRYFRANNTAYMVLPFEEGQSLKNWLRNLGRVLERSTLRRHDVVLRRIDRDAIHPCIESAVTPEFREISPGLDECFLDHIFGKVIVIQQSAAQGHNAPDVEAIQLFVGTIIIIARTFDEQRFIRLLNSFFQSLAPTNRSVVGV